MDRLLCILARKSRSQLLRASSKKQCKSQSSNSCYCCQVLKGEITTYFVQHTKQLELLSLDEVLAGIARAQNAHEAYFKIIQSYLQIPLPERIRKIYIFSFLDKVKFATVFT